MSQNFATMQKGVANNGISKKCLMWSEEQYEGANSLGPTFCRVCEKPPSEITITELGNSLKKEIEAHQSLIEPKNEGLEGDFENPMEGDFTSDVYIKGEDYEAIIGENPEDGYQSDDGMLCNECNKVFKSKRSLYGHMREKHGSAPEVHLCPDCGASFGRKSNMRAHMRVKCKVGKMRPKEHEPPLTYSQLIAEALRTGNDSMLRHSDICQRISKKYSYYKMEDKDWQYSIGHHLSKNSMFEAIEARCLQQDGSRGRRWTIKVEPLTNASIEPRMTRPPADLSKKAENLKPRMNKVMSQNEEGIKVDAAMDDEDAMTDSLDEEAMQEAIKSENLEDLKLQGNKVNAILGEANSEAGVKTSYKTCNEFTNGLNSSRQRRSRLGKKFQSCSDCGDNFATLSLLRDHCKLFNHVLKYACDFCDERFSSKYDKSRHVSHDHSKMAGMCVGKWYYKCPLCTDKLGNDKYVYWDHLRLSHREESVDCKVESCHYTCVGPQLMNIHNLTKHEKHQEYPSHRTLTCEICGRQIMVAHASAHYRKDHYITLDDGRRTKCDQCGEIFKTQREKLIHVNEVHLKISYDCDKCDKSFKRSINQLRQHIQKVHMKESQKKQCQVCGEWLSNSEELSNHVRAKHTGETPFKCVFCEESFFSAKTLQWHRRQQHPDSYEADQERKRWLCENPARDASEYKMKCRFCSEVRSTITELRQHWAEDHPGEADLPGSSRSSVISLICELCGATKQTRYLLKIHTFEVHDTDKTDCPMCLGKFPDRKEAMKHVKEKHKYPQSQPSRHNTEVCPQCGYVGTAGNMKTHVTRMHEKASIRPTACTYCNKEFSKFSSMAKHRKIAHRQQWNIDKERIMVEEGSVVDRSDYLKLSQVRKKYQQKSPCAICGRVLCSRQQLHLHMKALHGEGLPDYKPRSQYC